MKLNQKMVQIGSEKEESVKFTVPDDPPLKIYDVKELNQFTFFKNSVAEEIDLRLFLQAVSLKAQCPL